MTRHQAREQAFILLFEKTFTDDSIEQILEAAGDAGEVIDDPFALSLAKGTLSHCEEIDGFISEFSPQRKKERLSRMALSVLRLAIYEIQWCEEIPVSVSINEAVELAKCYGSETDAKFVNGVLGGISRKETMTNE